jgi:hypothetical protein
MLEMLTLCNARNRMTCKIRWDRLPRHNSAMVVNSTCAWNLSFPRIWFIASTRKEDAVAERMPTNRNARMGLAPVKVEITGAYRSHPDCWNNNGTTRCEKQLVQVGGNEGMTRRQTWPGNGAHEEGHASPESNLWVQHLVGLSGSLWGFLGLHGLSALCQTYRNLQSGRVSKQCYF